MPVPNRCDIGAADFALVRNRREHVLDVRLDEARDFAALEMAGGGVADAPLRATTGSVPRDPAASQAVNRIAIPARSAALARGNICTPMATRRGMTVQITALRSIYEPAGGM